MIWDIGEWCMGHYRYFRTCTCDGALSSYHDHILLRRSGGTYLPIDCFLLPWHVCLAPEHHA